MGEIVSSDMNSPVLLLIFNRPETTYQVFEKIKQARPKQLFIAGDGPRENVHDDKRLCADARNVIKDIDWKCELKTLFRESNLGCKEAVSQAIDWYFDHVECGIILEDDCLPHQSFFPFCDQLLQKYSTDQRVWMISGFNPRGQGIISNTYFFSENCSVWGWATWKNRWKNNYDKHLSEWPDEKLTSLLEKKYPKYLINYYKDAFTATKNGIINSWDYQWTYTILKNNGLVAKPYANLISNVGVQGTHSQEKDLNHHLSFGQLDPDNIIAPNLHIPDLTQDYWFYKTRIKSRKKFIQYLKEMAYTGVQWVKKFF